MSTERRTLVFATNNIHKISEIRDILGDTWRVLSLADIDCATDIPETADTLAGNAELKARYVKEHYGYDCFADDTGLLVNSLNDAPGVYSARYAGEGHDSQANMKLLLCNMTGTTDRSARFVTVIAYAHDDKIDFFEGECRGAITEAPRGDSGFGYDPVFQPEGFGTTFAQMTAEAKNSISHRGRATRKFIEYLQSTNIQTSSDTNHSNHDQTII